MDLDPIQDWVAANSTLQAGVDLFTYSMPQGVKKGVLLLLEVPDGKVDHEIPGRYWSRIQVIVLPQ